MSNLQSGADKAQMIELLNSIKLPIMGAGGGFAPIGTEITQFGTISPQGFLKCDGTVYNISDYPDLATYFASQFGSVNYFGGDGLTTFAVPNRSVSTKTINYNITTHTDDGGKRTFKQAIIEDVSEIRSYTGVATSNYGWSFNFPTEESATPAGYITIENNVAYLVIKNATASNDMSFSGNVTVQYKKISDIDTIKCVKATVSGDPNAHHYSTEEQIVGKDEYGNDVYEITLKGNVPANGTSIFSMVGKTFLEATGRVRYKDGGYVPIGWYYGSDNCIRINTQDSSDGLLIYWSGSLFENQPYRITVKYTKTTS